MRVTGQFLTIYTDIYLENTGFFRQRSNLHIILNSLITENPIALLFLDVIRQ